MADVNKITKFLGVELSKNLLQWTSKMENYKRYKWTTGDLSVFGGPPLVPKAGWNVEYLLFFVKGGEDAPMLSSEWRGLFFFPFLLPCSFCRTFLLFLDKIDLTAIVRV
jgi:hypothetical protein